MIDLIEPAPTFDDPLGMLRACHRRIERALDVVDRVAALEREGPLNDDAREALRRTLDYFATGVPRHAADEEQSLFPRLRDALGENASDLLAMMDGLAREHAAADSAHRELELLGGELLRDGRFCHVARRERFTEVVKTLRQLYREHIRIEDDELMPLAAGVVDPGQLEQVGADMAARRGIDWSQHQQLIRRLEARSSGRRPSTGDR
jgi:hemerythrin-like domain-containing protein